MEKRGVIEEGYTPPDEEQEAGEQDLEEHVTKRAAQAAQARLTRPSAEL